MKMEKQRLNEVLKEDAKKLLNIEPNPVSKNSLYGRLIIIWAALAAGLLILSLGMQIGLHTLGLYPLINGYWTVKTAFYSAIVSIALSFALRRPLLLSRLLNGKLECEPIIKQKCRNIGVAYLVVYCLCYAIISLFFNFSKYTEIGSLSPFQLDWILFDLRFTQFSSAIIALILIRLYINFELERVGAGFLFEGIRTFNERHKVKI